MKYILKTEVNENGNKVLSKEKHNGDTFYIARDEQGNVAMVDRDWVIKNKDAILNVSISIDGKINYVGGETPSEKRKPSDLNVGRNTKLCEKILSKADFRVCNPIGYDTKYIQSDIFFSKYEDDDRFIKFYICKEFGTWSIDYTYDKNVEYRSDMHTVRKIKTQKDLLLKIDELLLNA